MQIEINAKKRDLQGTGASRRLRRAGRVPGIVYGSGNAQSVDFDHKELYFGLKNEAFHSSVLTLILDGAPESVLLRDFQMHPYKQQLLHVDFQRVDATHKIHVKIPLHFINADTSAGVKAAGGVVSHVYTEVDVVCLPADLPGFIEVDLNELTSDHAIHMSHLKLPQGVELTGLHGEDPTVATILGAKAEVVEGEGEAPAA
jgi:large subunit ribosomal protein L25